MANINIKNCIGNSTDGAANMQGQYNSFNTWLQEEAGTQLHTWCYAHVLNLVMMDITEKNHYSITLFGLLNSCAVFFRESYTRMNILKDLLSESRIKTISVIAQTRWWSKDNALKKIFGTFNDPNEKNSIFLTLLIALYKMSQSDTLNSKIKYNARTLLDHFTKFETIVTANMYLKIFVHTSALSKYLQTQNMDVLQAHRMVETILESLKQFSRSSLLVYEAAKKFSNWANNYFDHENIEITVQDNFQEIKIRKSKIMDGDSGNEYIPPSAYQKFVVDVYNVTFDTLINSMEIRYFSNSKFPADCAFLQPSRSMKKFPKKHLQN